MGERKVKSGSLLYFFSSLNITLHTYIYMCTTQSDEKNIPSTSIVLRLSMAKFICRIKSDLKAIHPLIHGQTISSSFANFFFGFLTIFQIFGSTGFQWHEKHFFIQILCPTHLRQNAEITGLHFPTNSTNIFNSHCIKLWHNWVKCHRSTHDVTQSYLFQ